MHGPAEGVMAVTRLGILQESSVWADREAGLWEGRPGSYGVSRKRAADRLLSGKAEAAMWPRDEVLWAWGWLSFIGSPPSHNANPLCSRREEQETSLLQCHSRRKPSITLMLRKGCLERGP